jgi:flavin reductase (DIM6/NTAB) family NADH-FMN oxidoreductase RutF
MDKITLGPKALCYPEPVFLVGANVNGKPNFLAVAWGGIANRTPLMMSVAIRHDRYTMTGIEQNMTFSANIPSLEMVSETDYCGIVSGSKVDKTTACGFEVYYGKLDTAPLIKQCPVNLECRVAHLLKLDSHTLVIGKVIETYVAADCLTDNKPDIAKIKPFIYTSGPTSSYYAVGDFIARAFSAGNIIKKR